MKKPILVPGRPGDLMMMLKEAVKTLEELKEDTMKNRRSQEHADDTILECFTVGVSTYTALAMWLGIEEIPEIEIPN